MEQGRKGGLPGALCPAVPSQGSEFWKTQGCRVGSRLHTRTAPWDLQLSWCPVMFLLLCCIWAGRGSSGLGWVLPSALHLLPTLWMQTPSSQTQGGYSPVTVVTKWGVVPPPHTTAVLLSVVQLQPTEVKRWRSRWTHNFTLRSHAILRVQGNPALLMILGARGVLGCTTVGKEL